MALGSLAGRLALVTGAGSGIGKAVTAVLAREGALCAVCDLDQNSANNTLSALPKYAATSEALSGQTHKAFSTNVSSVDDVSKLIENIYAEFSCVPSVVVHSAGVARDCLLLKLDEKTWNDNIDTNLKGTFLINQAFARAMVKDEVEKGSIVNISSIIGKTGNIGQAAYAASKSGVIGFTKSAAQELAKNNIRVNAVLPGFIETPMTNQVPSKMMQRIIQAVPLRRMGGPEEIAEVCAFLASDKSSYVTGATIEATGGLFM